MGFWKNLVISHPSLAWHLNEMRFPPSERQTTQAVSMDLIDIIVALDGEDRASNFVRCPYLDGTMTVIFNDPARPSDFYIYSAPGNRRDARAYIQDRLRLLPDAPPKDYSADIAQIWSELTPAEGTLVETYLRSRGITSSPSPRRCASIRSCTIRRTAATGRAWLLPFAILRATYARSIGHSWPAMALVRRQ